MGLEFYSSPTGAGIGVGTVTSVSSSSNSLANNSAPNPITGVGNISFEVQIIDITSIALAILEAGSGCLEGVMYRVTDFNHTTCFGTVDLETAEFMTVKKSNGDTVLDKRGTAHSSHFEYQVVWDCQNDFILSLYLPDYNQKAERTLTGGMNCIENAPFEDASCTNFYIYESTISNGSAGSNVINNTQIFNSTIDFNSLNADIFSGTLIRSASVLFNSDDGFLNGCTVQPFANLDLSDNCNKCYFGDGCVVSQAHGAPLSGVRVGIDDAVNYNAAVTDKTYESNINEIQVLDPTDGGSDTVTDSFCTHIFIHLHPDAAPPVLSYNLLLPAKPLDGQVFHFGCDQAMAGVIIDPNGHTIDSSIAVVSKNQCWAYYYDLATDTYYLV